jgi:triosephosphate isomerase
MRRPLVAGNWKLNGSRPANTTLLRSIREALRPDWRCDVMVCPPFIYLAEIGAALQGSPVLLGAQDCSAEDSGAFTGEVAARMLREVGCTHVIVGHSERRRLHGESDALVARKFQAVRAAGLQPILCIGETLEERQRGATEQVVTRQLGAVLDGIPLQDIATSIVAYEPVWAIGTGHTATPDQAQQVHAYVRAMLSARDARIAAELRILYGGSVNGANAAALFAMPDIDGGLIGGASLVAAEFVRICSAAAGKAQ